MLGDLLVNAAQRYLGIEDPNDPSAMSGGQMKLPDWLSICGNRVSRYRRHRRLSSWLPIPSPRCYGDEHQRDTGAYTCGDWYESPLLANRSKLRRAHVPPQFLPFLRRQFAVLQARITALKDRPKLCTGKPLLGEHRILLPVS